MKLKHFMLALVAMLSGFAFTANAQVAKVGDTEYATLSAAFAAVADDAQSVVILQDVTEELTGAYLRGNITTENGAKVAITLTNDDWVYCPYTFVLGENVTLNVPALFYYAGASQIDGTVIAGAYYQRYAGTKLTINEPGSMTVTTEMFYLRYTDNDANAGIYIVGDNNPETIGLNLSVAYFYQGMINAKDANIKAAVYWQTNDTDNQGSANLVLDNSTLDVTVNEHDFKATGNSTVTLKNNSHITVAGDFVTGDNTVLSGDATSSITDKDGKVVLPVAQIGETPYETLQAAIAAATEGQTVTLIADVQLTEQVVIDGKVLTIDLNGQAITVPEATNHIYALSNKGTLTINDSKGNGSISSRGIYNYGSLTLNAGTINAIDGDGGYAVNNESGSTFVMNGGVLAATYEDDYLIDKGGYDATALDVPAGCTATLNGGTINNVCDFTFAIAAAGTLNIPATSTITVNGTHGAISVSGGTTTINAGTFQIPADEYSRTDNVLYVSGGSLVVNGGTFIGDSDTAAGGACLYDAAGTAVVNGGTFKGSSGGDVWGTTGTTIKGGIFTNLIETQHIADGYAALPNLDGEYVVGAKPTATVNNLGMTTVAAGEYSIWDGSFDQNTEDDGDMPLSFVMQFLADQDGEDMANSPYADWYGDFVLTFSGIESGSFTADGCYLAGHYGSFGWVKVPVDGMKIEEGARYPVMLGVGLGQKYDYICSSVEDFKCALYLTPEILEANPNIQVKLELGLVDNSKGSDAATTALINNENVCSVTEYTYDAEDFVVPVGLTGEGTEANPYLIKTVDDLILFRNSVNAGETKYNAEGVYVALGADIDLAGQDWSVNIGDDCAYTFDGIFDGKNFTISNLTAVETAQKGDGYICTGLFGAIYGNAVVKNLTIENVTISTGDFTGNNVGAVVGFAYSCKGSIENVNVTGDINIDAPNAVGVGAIVGYDYYSPALVVADCEVSGNNGSAIVGLSYVGGAVGYASNKIQLNANTIENVSITAMNAAAGGVAGIMLAGGVATDNTVENVTLASLHENWNNAVGVVAGTITTGKVTIANTEYSGVNTDALAGAIHANKPTTPVTKVEARIDNVYYTTFEAAYQAVQESETITLLAPVVIAEGETLTLDKNVTVKNASNFEGTLNINAGTYDTEVTESCAKGFICQDNGDGTYSVVADPNYIEELTFVDGEFTEYTYATEVKVGTFTYQRTFRNANVWNAIYLPFEIPVAMLADDYDVAYINDVHSADENGDGEIAVSEMKMEVIKITNEAAILKANHPYLLRAKSDEAKAWSITLTDATLYPAAEETYECSSMYTTYSITGTCRTRTTDELANSLVMSVNGAWVTSTTGMNPFRLCLTMADRNGSPVKVLVDEQHAMRISVRGEADTTGLESIELEQGAALIYDLQGRRVLDPQKGNLYIINGKKVIF